ncbi:MAG TPA: hypothetical protein VM452_09355 [Caulifigura sp.]|nr:hypothetical protein [Caulifigura sp.]
MERVSNGYEGHRRRSAFAVLVALLSICHSALVVAADGAPKQPVQLILDFDMESDCDDAGALAMAHILADRGECDILAVLSCSRHQWTVPCIDAINTYYGRPDLPIGQVAKGVDQDSKYTRFIAEHFPNDCTRETAIEAVRLQRQLLAKAADGSIVFVTLGYLTNQRDLLASGPDDISPLSGRELILKKVNRLVSMGSRYPADTAEPNVPWGNFRPDPESAITVAKSWPTLIHFTGGGDFAMRCGCGDRLHETPEANPVRRVYELFFAGKSKSTRQHSADQIAIWVAVRGVEPFFRTVTEGHNEIDQYGRNAWKASPDNPLHQYTSDFADGVDPAKASEAFNSLMNQPPKSAAAQPAGR